MITATPVNASLIQPGRPVSLVAAIGVLGASLWISHVGLVAVFQAGQLAGVMTALLVCLSTLQWMSMGRARAARSAGARSQARLTVANAALLFVLESTLNTIGVVMLAAETGGNWGSGAALLFAIAIAAGVAWLNLTVKFAACEPLETKPAAPSIEIESEPPPAARNAPATDNVVPFSLRDRTQNEAKTLLAIYQMDMERPRQAELEAMAKRRDENGRWKPAQQKPAAARQRKRKAA